ncbi:CD99 antigen-like protein 2 [Tachyglossus aculeatus]|uniref:CD99 antigen-like protein 2 n=1 Tax=Tachyglossus aculeatus TaxID=9261 RepID=UPI0018F37A78|nr:CD99 antigen-like protein 2 [Tachyglossus aculeatus]
MEPRRLLLVVALSLAALAGSGSGDSDFSLEDALSDLTTKKPDPVPPKKPSGGTRGGGGADTDLDLFDALDDQDDPHDGRKPKPNSGGGGGFNPLDFDLGPIPPKPTTKPYPKRPGGWDHIQTTTTKRPRVTKAPPKIPDSDFDLSDALDDRNDPDRGGKPKPNSGGGGLSDQDLEDILNDGYKPDKDKGGGFGSNDDPGTGKLLFPEDRFIFAWK